MTMSPSARQLVRACYACSNRAAPLPSLLRRRDFKRQFTLRRPDCWRQPTAWSIHGFLPNRTPPFILLRFSHVPSSRPCYAIGANIQFLLSHGKGRSSLLSSSPLCGQAPLSAEATAPRCGQAYWAGSVPTRICPSCLPSFSRIFPMLVHGDSY